MRAPLHARPAAREAHHEKTSERYSALRGERFILLLASFRPSRCHTGFFGHHRQPLPVAGRRPQLMKLTTMPSEPGVTLVDCEGEVTQTELWNNPNPLEKLLGD